MKNVLVVDDDLQLQKLYKLVINKTFKEVNLSQAFDGSEALDICNSLDFCAIISDIDMPTWAPGGAWIAFIAKGPGAATPDLYRVALVDSRVTREAPAAGSQVFTVDFDSTALSSLGNRPPRHLALVIGHQDVVVGECDLS